MSKEFDLEVVFTPAMMGYKRKSLEICSSNNLSKWWRHSKTRIKNEFQDRLKEWYLPKWEEAPYRWAEIHFTILRTNQRKMDSDSLSASTYKWAIDVLVTQSYLTDDDQCRVVLNPTQLGVSGNAETSVKMQIKFKEQLNDN